MSNMETNEFYSTLLNDAWTVYMTFCGILISIITLLYSVILGKRSELEIGAFRPTNEKTAPNYGKSHQKNGVCKQMGVCHLMCISVKLHIKLALF